VTKNIDSPKTRVPLNQI